MKERWIMKALGDQAVDLGNRPVEEVIKSVLEYASHVPNSEPLSLWIFSVWNVLSPFSVCPAPVHYGSNVSSFIPSSSGKMLFAATMCFPKLCTLVLEVLHMCLTPPKDHEFIKGQRLCLIHMCVFSSALHSILFVEKFSNVCQIKGWEGWMRNIWQHFEK